MAEQQAVGGYSYETDDVKQSTLTFGLNKNTFLKKFEWIPNGGKDGAEGEALDIVFNINGTEKGYRMFPVTQGFDKAGNAVTDPNSQEFKDALKDFNARVFHIAHNFVAEDTYKTALSRPIANFKEFCGIVKSLMPASTPTIPLDIFLQYQWAITGNNNRTYLDIPKKMSYGKWLTKSMPGTFTEHRLETPKDTDAKALWYINENGVEHLFVKNGWFMTSNFANQQKIEGRAANTGTTDNSANTQQAAQNMNAGAAPAASTTAAAW